MKKFLSFLFVVLLGLSLGGVVFADATYTSTNNGKSTNVDYAFGAIVDQTNGYTQHVDSEGAAYVQEKVNEVVEMIGTNDTYAGTTVKSGACRLKSITFGGPTAAAGDYLLVYDATSATGTPKFDVSVGTAKDTNTVVIPGGVKMATGIFAKSTTSTGVATITYDD